MQNRDLAAIFFEMADLMDIKGGDRYRVRAFRRIGRVLENLGEPVETMLKYGKLERVPGIGEGAVFRIKEILRTGTCPDQRALRRSLPSGLRDLLELDGLGPKTVKMIYQQLRIGSVDELEAAAISGKLTKLPRFGERTQERILQSIAHFRRNVGRVPLLEALRIGLSMVEAIRSEPAVLVAELAGSARRRKESIGDLDILVASHDPLPVIARFVTLREVAEVKARGDSKCSIRIHSGQQVDLRVVPRENVGAAMHYFTGSQQHNIYIRARGNRRSLKISEHGVFRRKDDVRLLAGETEEEIFAAVGLQFIPPELRENTGEIEAAAEGRLPKLIEEGDIRGDLHAHTRTSDGRNTAREMAAAARATGLEYLAITDHSGAGGTPVLEQARSCPALSDEVGIHVLGGMEVDILPDGSLAMDPRILRELDYVVASVHSHHDQDRAAMTARIIRAIESGLVDCVGHPTGRQMGSQEPSELDLEKILRAARSAGVSLELNSNPIRLDLDAVSCRAAREAGVPIAIDSDAHSVEDIPRRKLGVYVARRGWLERKDVINAGPVAAIQQLRRDRLRKAQVAVAGEIAAVGSQSDDGAEEDLRELERALSAAPLGSELLARLEEFLRGGRDAELETALRRVGGANPLQKAFELVLSADQGLEVEVEG